jgi:hypothetical protein
MCETHFHKWCRNLSLGFVTKVRPRKGVGQELSLGVTFHTFMSVGECEGMSPHSQHYYQIGVQFTSLNHYGTLKVK